MHAMEERARSTGPGLPGSWRPHLIVILVLLVGHLALFYGIAHTRVSGSSASAPPMFGPVVSQVWRASKQVPLSSRPWEPSTPENELTPPSRRWRFPRIDLWPSAAGYSATLSEFTPVTEAQADPPEVPAAGSAEKTPQRRRSALRMVRWLRPEYPMEWASMGIEGSVLLELRIDPSGQPLEIRVARSSGAPQLDDSVLRAARLWRFAPPVYKTHPVGVETLVEVRFNRS